MSDDEKYMYRCLQLARQGELFAFPNPMVGAVIVHEGRIIGEGWHRRCGGPHAEVNAIASVHPEDIRLLNQSTIYVSLEPCSHWGKTPPCADLIIEKGIRRVVCGCMDPFAKVRGRGIKRLREAGCEVVVGVLEVECRALNRRFMAVQTNGRPWITLKWAQSADGFIDRKRNSIADGKPCQFSTAWTRMKVHKLRAMHGAIVVGRRTWELDEPLLTTRFWPGPSPLRYVLSKSLATLEPQRSPAQNSSAPAWILCHSIDELLLDMAERNIQSVLIEGGRDTLQGFIDRDLWDEAYIEKTDIMLGEGVKAPSIDLKRRCKDVNFT
ncbi:MAG: bifunctional diaminohydroxyphosphoribosylaminopyrimidine deaminase/5-amino-6-(5-phosphoribosylamino)uracil reductase RibD [Bacteroidaceae bacterium]|nr:bifunctional diaminohydroxyphosphoribosylaminopyrimidine deaminase/5-amino-6-(5-phosphoribosylamino)uracil reductase RibD [Bacteroidaceae bacterium]